MFGSFLLGLAGPLVILVSVVLGWLIIIAGVAPVGAVVLFGGTFFGFYLRYLSKHTTRIRK